MNDENCLPESEDQSQPLQSGQILFFAFMGAVVLICSIIALIFLWKGFNLLPIMRSLSNEEQELLWRYNILTPLSTVVTFALSVWSLRKSKTIELRREEAKFAVGHSFLVTAHLLGRALSFIGLIIACAIGSLLLFAILGGMLGGISLLF